MKKTAIFTTTRAEFGILKPLISELKNESSTEVFLFVGGTHLAKEYGSTINEIKNNNFKITKTFDYLLNEDTPYSLTKSLGIETFELANIFNNFSFDAVCILGDRYELLPIVQTSILFRKPIIHLHGGEKSEGAIDEQIRHMITKASHLHFVACEEYAQNIIKMGEEKHRVYNTGALTVDNMQNIQLKNKNDLFAELGLNSELPTVLMTYHPVTLESDVSTQQQMKNVFLALNSFNLQIMITAPNIDAEREEINNIINEEVKKNDNYYYIESLGANNFHNLMKYSEFIIGNSSSGIVEAPFYRKPTVNIGIRQQGRIKHESIIDTNYSVDSIKKGIEIALSSNFSSKINNMKYKFGKGNTAKKMVSIIKNTNFNDTNFLIKKLTFK
ncbi:MAG: UDP-N-acetylglucosamine 2-epimerase [Bacteroidales bacterium]|nr:UDP-N-acetylglucosamine 2-epimerase [Bacteroidales bacterium]